MVTDSYISKLLRTLNNIPHKVIHIEDCNSFDFNAPDNSIVIVFAQWSGPAIVNFCQTIRLLDESNYEGKVLLLDIDYMSSNQQIKTFGEICQGWSEIFIYKQGKMMKRFTGRNSFKNFKEETNVKFL